ncbi:MAG TPA: SCO family protein, partial [Terracidiphilus sp.]
LKGKVVMLNFVHVGCPGMCDTLINKFGQIADAIRPELGSRVVLVTITNDPEHDRPSLLLKLARDRQADMSGWLFLTGTAADVARITTAFGVDNRRLPDGSPNHITRVFMLGPDLRQEREYAGMGMNSQRVVTELKVQ